MESSKQLMIVNSPPEQDVNALATEAESQFASVIFDVSQQVQLGMEDLLKTITEIDAHTADVTEEMEKCKAYAIEKGKAIQQEKECFQKAAYAVLDMLNVLGERTQNQMLPEPGSHREF